MYIAPNVSTSNRKHHTYLRRLVNRSHDSSDAQRHVRVLLVPAVQVADALVPGYAPVVQKSLDQVGILKHDVVDVPIGLAIQGNGVGLALAADALGPRRVILAAAFYATANVF